MVIKGESKGIYHYKHHKEICYCLEGDATLIDLDNNIEHHIKPGSLWAAVGHEKFRFIANKPTRLISIFDPALIGPETNDEEGSFPLLEGESNETPPQSHPPVGGDSKLVKQT